MATVLVTGGGSGIGLVLAQRMLAQGDTVIIAGRTRAALDDAARANPGLHVEDIDAADPASVTACAARVADRFPGLDTLVNNAGIQSRIDFTGGDPVAYDTIAPEIAINLTGLIHVTASFLPLLRRAPSARVIHISSGLAYVPLAAVPVYCATKAGVHSFTLSLRRQLRGGTVRIIEIIPPAVATNLHRSQTAPPPGAMTLTDFADAAMAGLAAGREEIRVGRVRALYYGARVMPARFLDLMNAPRPR